jgi:hypothetical protein
MMSAMLAVVPATPDRPIDELDKVYTRLMLGDRAMNRKAPAIVGKSSVLTETRQLKRKTKRARTKQQQTIDKASGMG